MHTARDDNHVAEMTAIYRQTVRPLYEFVSRRTGSRQLAEDITQEAYLRLVAHRRRSESPEKVLAWLLTVARNLLINHYRRKRPQRLEVSSVEAVLQSAPLHDPDAASLVCWGLARLGRRPRELLEAFYIEGKSVRAIAEATGLSERAIEGRLRRARQALNRKLAPLAQRQGDPS